MNKGHDEEMENIMDESPFEMGDGPDDEDPGRDRPYGDPGSQKKFLILGGIGILLLILLIIVFFGTSDRSSSEELTTLKTKINRIGARLTQLDEIENRIALLQKQQKELRQSISRLDNSGKFLIAQLGELTQKLGSPKKGATSGSARTKTSSAIKKKAPTGTKSGYYVVRRGDSLFRIAKKHNLSVNELCRLNEISTKQAIKPGQRLLIASGER